MVGLVRVTLDLGTRRRTSHLEARLGNTPAAQQGWMANPLLASTGPKPDADSNNEIELQPASPMSGRYLILLRTDTADQNDLALRVDEVYVHE